MFSSLFRNHLRNSILVGSVLSTKVSGCSMFGGYWYSNPSPNNTNKTNDKNAKILIFGESGAGKSTLINTLTNYLRNGSLNNLKISIPTMYLKPTEEFNNSEHDVKNNGKSQTKKNV